LDPGNDPRRYLRDDDEGLQDYANDEYIWPVIEDVEDD
jgi:hypothetical protein